MTNVACIRSGCNLALNRTVYVFSHLCEVRSWKVLQGFRLAACLDAMALQLARTRVCSSVCPAQRPIARCSLLGLRSLPSLPATSSSSRAVACRAQTEDRDAVEKRREPASGGELEKAGEIFGCLLWSRAMQFHCCVERK